MSAFSAPIRFGVLSFLSFKALSWDGVGNYVWGNLARPVFFVTMFALAGRFAGNPSAAEAYIVGMVASAHPATIMGGVLAMFTIERNFAILPILFATSGSRFVMIWSRGLIHMGSGWVSVAVSLFFAAVVLKLDLSRLDWITLLVATAVIGFSSTAFALCAGNFALILRQWTDLRTLLEGSVVAFTGAVIPLAALPGAVAAVGHVLPLTAGLVAFRAAFQGDPVEAVTMPLAQEAAIGIVYAVLGALLFLAIERQAKRMGSLDWEARA
ncbi:MAG TPA: hypothetical protein VGK54_16205 [Chloroflexota bacterium]|jgi:ABC-2 type transport system permease protein